MFYAYELTHFFGRNGPFATPWNEIWLQRVTLFSAYDRDWERRIGRIQSLPHAVFEEAGNEGSSAMQQGRHYIGSGGDVGYNNTADLQVVDQVQIDCFLAFP